jgi:hypothetical protein
MGGTWPMDLKHHTYITREEWVPFVKDNASMLPFVSGPPLLFETANLH